jgi:hypothetical protein
MRNFFAPATTVDELPSWEADERVTTARRHAHTLKDRQEALQQQAAALRHSGDGSLVTIPSPSHPSWPVQREYEEAHRQWQVAERQLAQIEREAQDELAELGYKRGQKFYDEQLRPAIEQLHAVLQAYAQLQVDVRSRTSVTLGDLGSLPLVASKIPEWLEGLHRRGVFGNR